MKINKRFGKKAIAWFLAVIMMLSMLPMQVLAEGQNDEGGQETAGGWVLQRQNTDTNVELQEGWITATEDGSSVTIDYSKIVNDTGNEGWIVFDDSVPRYLNSSLEYDITFTEAVQPDFIATAIATRVTDGKNYEGFAITSGTDMERTGRKNGSESYSGINNLLGVNFEYSTTYHLRMDTIDNNITVYLTRDGKEEKLTSFESPIGLGESTYGFRIWRGGKKIKLENIKRTEIVASTLDRDTEQIAKNAWGQSDASIPIHFESGDSVASVYNGESALAEGTDYTVIDDNLILKKEYIVSQNGSFLLQVNFTKGSAAALQVMEIEDTTEHEWVLQRQSTDTNVELQEGWITSADNGRSVTIDYGKIVNDTGNEGWIVFDDSVPRYLNSSLEYDITFTEAVQPDFIATAVATRVTDGKNYEGFAITSGTGLERTGRKSGTESYSSISNLLGVKFEYNTTYHLRMETIGNKITVYLTRDGKEEKLASFESTIGLGESTFGLRIWRGGKKIKLENIKRTEIIISTLDRGVEQIANEEWGQSDVSIPIHFGREDSVASVYNSESTLAEGTDYTVIDDTLMLKKEYIASQNGIFRLQVNFTKGSTAALWIMEYDPTAEHEYVWTPDQGINMWKSMEGSGNVELQEDGMRVTGRNVLINELAPLAISGEIELTFEFLNDNWQRDQMNHGIGCLFRADQINGSWQSLAVNSYVSSQPVWSFVNSEGTVSDFTLDGDCFVSLDGVKDYKVKLRFVDDSLTLWMDDQFAHSNGMNQVEVLPGNMGLIFNGNLGDILVKKVVFREVNPMQEETGERQTTSITNDGLTVRLDQDFPRVADYELNGKKLGGSELRYNYVTINTVNIPATAEITAQSEDSVTYHVAPDPQKTGVTFDVVFNVQKDQILEMLIKNIAEPEGELVNSIGLPNQPLISANSSQSGAKLDASWVFKGPDNWGIRDIRKTIANKDISTTATFAVAIPIITTDELSASMFNNVYIDGDEFVYRAFNRPDGEVTAGFWNNEFMYRGLDEEKILPFASEPDEKDLYCRIVITEDTNGDDQMDWQDGANALKKLTSDAVPGGHTAARRFFHVGYNFASGVQQPFLKVGDNMKRLSSYMDGFGQNLVFKGYANEGHDSGHADYADINKRAGGAEGMNVAIAEADKINSDFGIHINHAEAYPEAKMFNDHLISGMDAWRWMDQARYIRRDVDMLEGTFDARLDALFEQTPDLDFVYVDCWEGDRWGELKLIGNMLNNGAEMFATENAPDLQRFGVWVHSTGGTSANGIHQFVYNTQKDTYPSSSIYWGGYGRGVSMMSWQHNNNINTLVEQFYTNQLAQKYLMCHEVLKQTSTTATFEGNITSSNWVITKDGNKITDGQGKIFIPWYAEDSETCDPDEAAKIYHWNSTGGETTWILPNSWDGLKTVYLYQTTQNGKKLVGSIDVKEGQVTINASAKTPYVVYPCEAAEDVIDWSVGSLLKDTGFNTRDFSIWKKDGNADIAFNDDSNGVSILTMTGAEAGQVSQTMKGLTGGQKYRVLVYAGAENGKTARLTVKTPDGKSLENYLEQVIMANQYFDNYAKNKMVQLMWVDFIQPVGETTAVVTLSGDACEAQNGKATFMESRIVKTAEPDLPKGYVANETFEYIEQGAYGIFNPERSADGVPHLSETHLPYTNDTISGDWSLKMYGHYGQGDVTVRTSPATVRLMPNTEYMVEFTTIGAGTVYVESESNSSKRILQQSFSAGASSFKFATDDVTDYIIRIGGSNLVLDDFVVRIAVIETTDPTITVNEDIENGCLTYNPKDVKPGDKVTVTPDPISNSYIMKEGSLKYNGTVIEKDENGEYTFIMPNEDVVLAAKFIADMSSLKNLVTACGSLKEEDYTAETWVDYAEALTAANAVLEDEDSSLSTVMAARLNLLETRLALRTAEKANKTYLEELLKQVKVIDTTGKRPELVTSLNEAMAAAEDVLKNDYATQEQVNDASNTMFIAIINLKDIVDRSDVEDLIALLDKLDEEDYTADSWEALTDAIEEAENLNDNSTLTEVSKAYKDLCDVYGSLVKKDQSVNKKALKSALDDAKLILDNIGDFIPSTVKGLKQIYDSAKAVYDNPNATQEEIDKAYNDLQAELQGVTEISVNAPSGLKATKASATSIKLTWNKASDVNGYEVWYSTSKDGAYQKLASPALNSYTHSGLTIGMTYYYKVCSFKEVGEGIEYVTYNSKFTDVASLNLPVPIPTGVKTASAGARSIKVSWKKVNGATGYEIYRSTGKAGRYTNAGAAGAAESSYTDKNLKYKGTYYYKVRAYKTIDGVKKYSAYTQACKRKAQLNKPAVTLKAGKKFITVKWKKVAGAAKYEIYRTTSKNGKYKKVAGVSAKKLSYTNKGLTKGKKYYYKVKAVQKIGKKTYKSAYSVRKYKKAK